MYRVLIPAFAVLSIAGPAAADTRFLAYDASDRVTTALTRGVTLEVERGLFGAVAVRRIISTTQRGSARIDRGGPNEARAAIPEDANADNARQGQVYTVDGAGDGRGLSRALCPGADATYLVIGRVRAVRPLTMHAVGRWSDGKFRHCVQLSYDYRGEWALPPAGSMSIDGDYLPQRPD